MSRLVFYDHESFHEVIVPYFTMESCRRHIEKEYPKYGQVVTMSYEPIGKIGIVRIQTSKMTVIFFGVAVEFIHDRRNPR